jgi:uncharacterized membrane protein YebE (DUF533 family)
MALAAIGWADGQLHPEEADAIVRTALEEGLELDEVAEIEEATKAPITMGQVDLSKLTKEDRLFIYAVASWMTRLDGETSDKEVDALAKLGDVLKIPEKPRQHADIIVQEVMQLPDGDSPARYDLPKVRQIITERLAEARRLRAEAAAQQPPAGKGGSKDD